MEARENVPLAPYTTFQIGGPARWFVDARSEEDVLDAVAFAGKRQIPLFILGGGSNVLVADAGFDGLVLHLASSGIEERPTASPGMRSFLVHAGENWDNFVSQTVTRDCGGLECLAGIPGTVGGTPVQNVGAYGQEVSTTITYVRALDLDANSFIDIPSAQCGFDYRQSIFNTTEKGHYIVIQVCFLLEEHASPCLSYIDLKRYFKEKPAPTLAETAAAVREIRLNKGMLLMPGDPDCRSAGSFFKNPIVDAEALRGIASALKIEPAEVPHYPAGKGKFKVPAAWLLEQAGFHKGFALGPAAISTRHTLALTNLGNARAADILALRDRITEEVGQRFGIRLEQEPVLLGQS
jgi:UDP-N-acetylmuramate dehydrogenase